MSSEIPVGTIIKKPSWAIDILRNALYDKVVIKTLKDASTQENYPRAGAYFFR